MKAVQRHPYLVNQAFREYLIATVLATTATSTGIMVDAVIVGNLIGVDAMAAVNLAAPVLQFFNAATFLLNAGGAILAAHAIGRRDENDARFLFTISIILSVACGLILMLVGLGFSSAIAEMLCPSSALRSLVLTYARIALLNAPVYLLLPGLCFFIRLDGAPKKASVALVIANICNLSLDVVFIKGFGWGTAGSALATTGGFAIGLVIALDHFLR